jgi:hypothetical protein
LAKGFIINKTLHHFLFFIFLWYLHLYLPGTTENKKNNWEVFFLILNAEYQKGPPNREETKYAG